MKVIKGLAVSALASISCSVFAQQSCADYPYRDGLNVEDVKGGTKILATASASVSFDDIDSIKDAREEAELTAMAAISDFMTRGIKSDQTLNKVVKESRTTSGQQSERVRNELVTRVKNLASSSSALLRGAVVLGDCYTKGREVRVSVGIKPETIKAAENLAESVSKSVSSQATPKSQSAGTSGQGTAATGQPGAPSTLRGIDGYSDTERLKKF